MDAFLNPFAFLRAEIRNRDILIADLEDEIDDLKNRIEDIEAELQAADDFIRIQGEVITDLNQA